MQSEGFKPVKWVVLATAPDQIVAEMWNDLLVAQDIPAAIRPEDTMNFLGVTLIPCRVIVADNELARAKELLESQLGLELDDS